MSSDRAHTVIMHLTTIHHKSIPLDNLPGVNLVNLLILRKGRVLIVAKHPGPLRGEPPVRSPIPCRAAKHTRATQHATGMRHRSACDGNVCGGQASIARRDIQVCDLLHLRGRGLPRGNGKPGRDTCLGSRAHAPARETTWASIYRIIWYFTGHFVDASSE